MIKLVRILCAILFCAFTFLYLYLYQGDVLTVSQHVMSEGRTSYHVLIGAVLITVVLQLLQLAVAAIVPNLQYSHAATYLPSFVALGALTSIVPQGQHFHISGWAWFVPIFLLLFGFFVWLMRKLKIFPPRPEFTIRLIWVNLVTMVVGMLFVGLTGFGDEATHLRLRAARYAEQGDYKKIMQLGRKSQVADTLLTTLRIYALSQEGRLGDQLFSYPLCGGSQALLPRLQDADSLVRPAFADLYRHLGAYPHRRMQPMEYLDLLHQQKKATPAAHDYLLCGLLMDKRIDEFARRLPKFYALNDSAPTLPKHYREALTLYMHQRSNPVLTYKDEVMEADYADMREMMKGNMKNATNVSRVRDTYKNTYWFYYFFTSANAFTQSVSREN